MEIPDPVYEEDRIFINCDVAGETNESFSETAGILAEDLYLSNNGLRAEGENYGDGLSEGDWFCVAVNE